MRRIQPIIWILFLLQTIPVIHIHAQPPNTNTNTVIPGNLPSGVIDQLPQTASDRLKQLQDAGVPASLLPGQISSPNQSGYPEPMQVDVLTPTVLEGEEEVLDEDEKEYQNKPKEINEILISDPDGSDVYGHHLFDDEDVDFSLITTPYISDDYIVGPGDKFYIITYGRQELQEILPVTADGSIKRQYIGKIYVGGMRFGDAKEKIIQAYRNRIISSRTTVEVRLTSEGRAININFVGEVKAPGTYRIDAKVPAFNAIFAAGGINDIGSVRRIIIKRDNKVVQELDLYDFLLMGNQKPIYLEDNDFIYVPVQGKVAEISGPVNRPMSYELKPKENMKRLLEFAGGLSFDAKSTKAQVARLEKEREVLIDFNLQNILQDSNKDFTIHDGDRVILQSINKGAFNIVQIFGEVEYEGTYQLEEGDKLSDIVGQAGGLSIDAYRDRAYVVRVVPYSSELLYIPVDLSKIFESGYLENGQPFDTLFSESPENIQLNYFDAIIIFSQRDFEDLRAIEVTGQVRKPGVFKASPTMTLKDLLYLVGGLKDDADFKNIELTTITRAEDLDQRIISPEEEKGERIRNPRKQMEIQYDNEGNRKNDAASEGAEGGEDGESAEGNLVELIRRISVDKDWENDPRIDTLLVFGFDRIKVYSKYDFIFFKFIDIEGSVKEPGMYQLKRGMTLKDAIYMAGGLTEDASRKHIELYRDIDIELRGNFNTKAGEKEIVRIKLDTTWRESSLADSIQIGDYHKIVIRSELDFFQPGYAQIKGLVNKPGEYEVLPQMTLKDLIYMAEGLRMEADFDHIEISRVFESVSETGEIIPVPITINAVTSTQNWQDEEQLSEIKINPFDQVIVRKNPNFRLQESVFLHGEVLVEGEYNKSKKDETLSSLISRAGGVTELAYLPGAHIIRPEIGKIALKLDKALKRPNSKFNISLLEGDTLVVPARVDIVKIQGNVLRSDIKVVFESKKTHLKYYTRLAGGFAKRTKKNEITVTYVDGRVKGVRKFLVFRKYPKIEQGSTIDVARKPDRQGNNLPRINLQEMMGTITSFLTFYLLIDRTLLSTQ
jgi:protein involved in polysaccharide export with SLBB domain